MTTDLSHPSSSPLRRRMIEDMTVRNFVEKTRRDYIRHVKNFTAFLGRSPDTADGRGSSPFPAAPGRDRRAAADHQQHGRGAALLLHRDAATGPRLARHLTFVREPRKLPVVLSPEEVARLLEAAPGPKYKAALGAAYGAGLRVSRGRRAQGVRHRLRAHADPGRAGQGPQGPLRHAVAAAARAAARLVAEWRLARGPRVGCFRAAIRSCR